MAGGVQHASPDLRAGDVAEWELMVEAPGQYMIWCDEHGHQEKGMMGTLVVK